MRLADIKKQMNIFDEITKDRTKMDTRDLYGNECTIDDYVIVPTTEGEPYAVVHCKEFADNFHFAGKMETDLILIIDSDPEAKAEFKRMGVKVRYEEAQNKNRQKYTKVVMI